MALMDFIKKQFVDVIEWNEDSDGVLAWRFPMQEMVIQNGARPYASRKWPSSSMKVRSPTSSGRAWSS